jgi:hypothetical protein
MAATDKDILFYSQHCPYSQRAMELLWRPTVTICVDRHDCKAMLPAFVDRVPYLLVFPDDGVAAPMAFTDAGLFDFLERKADPAPPPQAPAAQAKPPPETAAVEAFAPGGLYSERYTFLDGDGNDDDACSPTRLDSGRARAFAYLGYEQRIDTPQAEPLPGGGDNKGGGQATAHQPASSMESLLARRTAELRM